MPTISQLPAASQVTAADQILISQGGSACSVNVGTLLAGTQPAITIPTGNLFGRTSLGPGGPDPIVVGTGLSLSTATLVATGADHASFAIEGSITLTDQVVVNSGGHPGLLPLPLLRDLFSAGSNIAIDQNGTISATAASIASDDAVNYIGTLPTVETVSPSDLVGINQSGTDHSISYINFIDGLTIDEVQAALPASGADTFLVAQSGNIMARQTFSALWTWLNTNFPSYQMPTVELITDTTLSAASHNGHLLICSQPVTVTPIPSDMGNGFHCMLINLSGGNVTLGSGIITSSGSASLPVGQAASLICATYSGGTAVYAWVSGTTVSLNLPAQVTGIALGAVTSSSVGLSWAELSPSPTSYIVQYRISGTTVWSISSPVISSSAAISGLSPSTSYDFEVLAVNPAGTGPASVIVTVSTAVTGNSVASITWNVVPSGSYTSGIGTIAVNAQITPSTAPVQFGFSTSQTVPPTIWAAGTYINTNLWGTYVNTPSSAGTYYAWVEGMDGSSPTVYPTAFSVT